MAGRLYLEHRGPAQLVRGADVDSDGDEVFLGDRTTGEKTAIACENIQALVLGPMSSISTKAVRSVVEGGCPILWMSRAGLRIEAMVGVPVLSSDQWVRRQMLSVVTPTAQRATVRAALVQRFGQEPPKGYSLNQLRGWEGLRMSQAYSDEARCRDIFWSGRQNEGQADILNALISALNAVIYSACELATVSMGMSKGLGFLHVGPEGWVYDIADHFKMKYSVNRAFNWFQNRPDYLAPMEPAFLTAWEEIPAVFNDVFKEFVDVCDMVLTPLTDQT